MDPVRETRVFAMTHIAIHDALNAIDRYAWDRQFPGASPEAAAAAAARDVLVSLLPSRTAQIQASYEQALAAIPNSEAKGRGITAGNRSASTILNQRTGDGSDAPGASRAGTQPGEYRPTAPDFFPAFLPDWGNVQPFALRNAQQFRPEAPYRLRSDEYYMDYAEAAAVGDSKSTIRTQEGNQIARYWYEGSGQGWNRIARTVAEGSTLDNWEAARLFALVNIAMADGFIGGFEAKYHYNYWRPITAIAEDNSDGNNDTIGKYGLSFDALGARSSRRQSDGPVLRNGLRHVRDDQRRALPRNHSQVLEFLRSRGRERRLTGARRDSLPERLQGGDVAGRADRRVRRREPPEGQVAGHPPAMAPTTRNGSLPFTTASGSGASGDSCDKSSSQAKNRTNGRRCCVT
jgi:hypothetical protein